VAAVSAVRRAPCPACWTVGDLDDASANLVDRLDELAFLG
jgi:hypothetical protein